MPAGRSFLPIAFLSLPLTAFAALWIAAKEGETVRDRLAMAAGFSQANWPFLLLASPDRHAALPAILGFCALTAACIFALASLAAAIRSRWPRGGETAIAACVLVAAIVPSWSGRGIAFSPFSALSNLFGIDWIRDGELYFQVPSESPLEYPDWRWYAISLLLAGAAFSFLANTWRRR